MLPPTYVSMLYIWLHSLGKRNNLLPHSICCIFVILYALKFKPIAGLQEQIEVMKQIMLKYLTIRVPDSSLPII